MAPHGTKDEVLVKGFVERAVEHDGNRYGILVDGEWWNGFGDAPQQGDEVEIAGFIVEKMGKTYHNVDSYTITASKEQIEEATGKQTPSEPAPAKKSAPAKKAKETPGGTWHKVFLEECDKIMSCVGFVEGATGKTVEELPELVRLANCLYIQTNREDYYEKQRNGGR